MAETFVKTLNNMGYMTSTLDNFSQEFINFCTSDINVFEAGAAFGIATRKIIKKGSKIWVNDLGKEHLDAIISDCSEEEKERVFTFPGLIQDLSFNNEIFDGIFSSRMIHLLKGEDIEKTLRNFFNWLKPSGKLVITSDTPFLKCYAPNIEKYETRRKKGEKWPGMIEDTEEFMKISFNNIPKFINFLDLETLCRSVKDAGFTVEKSEYISQESFPDDLKFDGRETAGVIAHKLTS